MRRTIVINFRFVFILELCHLHGKSCGCRIRCGDINGSCGNKFIIAPLESNSQKKKTPVGKIAVLEDLRRKMP